MQFIKKKVNQTKAEFDSFKISYEIAKLVKNVIDTSKFEGDSDESKFLKEENKIYFHEISIFLFEHDKQDYRKIWRDFNGSVIRDRYFKNKIELEKIVQEWDIVKNIFDTIQKISEELDINFLFENYKDKKFTIIPHNCFETIKFTINKNIKFIDDTIIGDNFKYSKKTPEKMKGFSNGLYSLKDMIEKLENSQTIIEKSFVKMTTIQKRPEIFLKLKQVS